MTSATSGAWISQSCRATLYESGSFRHVAGVSIFWETPIGPMRLNWSKALEKEVQDIDQNFEFTISTEF